MKPQYLKPGFSRSIQRFGSAQDAAPAEGTLEPLNN